MGCGLVAVWAVGEWVGRERGVEGGWGGGRNGKDGGVRQGWRERGSDGGREGGRERARERGKDEQTSEDIFALVRVWTCSPGIHIGIIHYYIQIRQHSLIPPTHAHTHSHHPTTHSMVVLGHMSG